MQEMKVTGEELCDYLTWAHFNAIPLMGDDARKGEYTKLATETCPSEYYNKVTETVLSVSENNKNLVSSAFLQNLVDKVNMATGKSAENADPLPLAFTNY